MKSSIVIIYNPAARKASSGKIEHALSLFEKKGFMPRLLVTREKGEAATLAKDAVGEAPGMIVAAGGDGTINEVINGVVGSDIPLSILPLGTTNVLAKELGFPENVSGAVERAISGKARTVSLGRIEWGRGLSSIRYFCLMIGIGFDARAVHDVNASIKKVSGKAAYILSGIKNLVGYSPKELTFRADSDVHAGYTAVIGKASKYGGNLRITPGANLEDPSLYACIFQGKRRTDLFRYVFGVVSGKHLKFRDVIYLKATSVEIGGEAHMQIDGDYLGISPARVTVAKDALKLIW